MPRVPRTANNNAVEINISGIPSAMGHATNRGMAAPLAHAA